MILDRNRDTSVSWYRADSLIFLCFQFFRTIPRQENKTGRVYTKFTGRKHLKKMENKSNNIVSQ